MEDNAVVIGLLAEFKFIAGIGSKVRIPPKSTRRTHEYLRKQFHQVVRHAAANSDWTRLGRRSGLYSGLNSILMLGRERTGFGTSGLQAQFGWAGP